MKKLYLGIDLGGTEIKLAIVDDAGRIIEEMGIPHNGASIPHIVTAEIIGRARNMRNFDHVVGTGIGVAGDIDQEAGIVRFSPNLGNWKKVPLRTMLKGRLPGKILIDNDANVAAVGAYWLDAKGKARNLICVTLGTGVGGGIICQGKLYRGSTGTAGELGHMSFDHDGPKCNCGSFGCIERYIGAPHLSRFAQGLVEAEGSPVISRLVKNDLSAITPHILARAATLGDPLAKRIWKDAGEKLGVVLASIINFYNPEMIVLAGGVSKAGRLLVAPAARIVHERAFATSAHACKIVVSRFTQKLGVVGAALLAK